MPGGRRNKRRIWILIALLVTAGLAVVCFAGNLLRAPAAAPSPPPSPSLSLLPTPASAAPEYPAASPETLAPVQTPIPPARQTNLYEVQLTVFADAKAPYVKGAMRLTYFNNSADVLYEVRLRLHPNDVSPGCMGVSDVAANNEVAYYTLGGKNESILSISLPEEIAPGGSAEIYLRFEIGLPATGNRFGVNETGIMLGNMLPIAAVYENGAWREDKYTDEGDAFYSECADYRVSVSASAKWELAHTGSLVERAEKDGVSTWYIAAPKSRDFALALMKQPAVEERMSASGTAVYAFGTNKRHAEFEASVAVAALDYFSQNIGTYPYDTFFVVPFDMGGGMEYPGLVMICENDLHVDDLSGAALVIGHETAHQWFYSVIGSDQINAPWLDESLVEYLGFDFLRFYLGEEAAGARQAARFGSLEGYKRTKRIDSALYDFAGSEYFLIVYASGYEMYDALYRELGRSAFYEALRTYFNANSFSIANRDDLAAAFSEAAGRDMAQWFEERLSY